jgi:hypothetical protein
MRKIRLRIQVTQKTNQVEAIYGFNGAVKNIHLHRDQDLNPE